MDAFIVAGYRSAVGKAKKGGFRFTRPDDLAADVIRHLVKSIPGLEPKRIDDLIVGNAVPEGNAWTGVNSSEASPANTHMYKYTECR